MGLFSRLRRILRPEASHRPGNEALQARRRALLEARESRRNPSAGAKVFLTGDGGHLGGRTAQLLAERYDVIGFDQIAGEEEGLENYDALVSRMRGADFVVHMAAIPHPRKGTIEDYFRVNVVGTFNVLRAAETTKIRRFIFFSSCAYYGWDIIEGKLWPAYFPIDEQHPIAAVKGRAEGKLVSYDQSKVMAEQLLAYYGTNQIFETIAFRCAPANKKATQYPSDGLWRKDPGFRRRGLFTNVDPDTIPGLVEKALASTEKLWYEPFNIVDRYTHEDVDVRKFLADEYPNVPLAADFSDNRALVTADKAVQILGYQQSQDRR